MKRLFLMRHAKTEQANKDTPADAERAIAALEDETGQEVSIAETVPWGVRLAIGGDPVPPPEKAAREAALRRTCLRRLRKEGLIGE